MTSFFKKLESFIRGEMRVFSKNYGFINMNYKQPALFMNLHHTNVHFYQTVTDLVKARHADKFWLNFIILVLINSNKHHVFLTILNAHLWLCPVLDWEAIVPWSHRCYFLKAKSTSGVSRDPGENFPRYLGKGKNIIAAGGEKQTARGEKQRSDGAVRVSGLKLQKKVHKKTQKSL